MKADNPTASNREYYALCAFPKPGASTSKLDRIKQLREDIEARRNHLKANPKCKFCGKKASSVHHEVSKKIGGTRTEVADRELVSVCDVCHGKKHHLRVVS